MMEEAGAVGAAWSAAARGWLTPAVLFVAINLVIATIAVVSRLMSSPGSAGAPGGRDDDEAAGEPRGFLLRAPSFLAVDRRLRSSFSFSRLGLAANDAQVVQQPLSSDDGAQANTEPSLQQQEPPAAEASQQLEDDKRQREEARVERSRSEAAAEAPPNSRRRLRARRAAAEELDGHSGDGEQEQVDARADDFIRRFREQLRLQRLDSILRYRDRGDSLRRTGTA